MISIRYNKISLITDDPIFIYPIGDTHIGHNNADLKGLISYLDSIPHETNHRILLMGDLVDCGLKSAVGASAYEQNMTPNEQLNYIVKLFKPFEGQIDGAVMGNHEYRIFKESGIDITEQFCNQLKIPYLLYSGVVTYASGLSNTRKFNRAYNINLFHGKSGGGVENALRACKAMSSKVSADVYLMGHCHYRASTDRIMKHVDSRNGVIIDSKQHFVLTGQMLKYDDSYADQMNLEIADVGFPILELSTKGIKKITVR